MQPYGYQQESLDALLAARERGQSKFLLVMAPGLGKTATAAFELKRLLEEDPGPVLYLCDQRHVLRQAERTFRLIVGAELKASFLFSHGEVREDADFVLATFQTMITERTKYSPDYFKYVTVDEVHHARARTFQPTVLYFRPKYMLGLTATIKRSDGLDVIELFDGHPPVFELGFFKALARGLSCGIDYRLMDDEIDYACLLGIKAGNIGLRGLNKLIFIPKRDEEIVEIIRQRTAHIKKLHMLVFCASQSHADRMAELLPNATCIHSGYSDKVNDERLAAFRRGDFGAITTVDMANEGVDIPEINVIVFLRTVLWYGRFIQQLGRGARLAEGKDELLALDFAGSCQHIEMVMSLYRQVQEAVEHEQKTSGPSCPSNPLKLTIGEVAFGEHDVEITALIKRIEEGNTVESLTGLLLSKAADLERSPFAYEVDDDPKMPCAVTVCRVFGVRKWDDVLIAIGLEPFALDGLSKDEIIRRMNEWAARIEHAPPCDAVDASPNFPSVNTMMSIFGVSTWNELVIACGLRPLRFTHLTLDERKAQLAAELKAKTAKIGRAPTATELQADKNMMGVGTYEKVFGCGYREVLRQLGLLKNTPEKLATELGRLRAKLGRPPKTSDINFEQSLPSLNTFYRSFGVKTWQEVLEKAWRILDADS